MMKTFILRGEKQLKMLPVRKGDDDSSRGETTENAVISHE
jgi:hypothetical protein